MKNTVPLTEREADMLYMFVAAKGDYKIASDYLKGLLYVMSPTSYRRQMVTIRHKLAEWTRPIWEKEAKKMREISVPEPKYIYTVEAVTKPLFILKSDYDKLYIRARLGVFIAMFIGIVIGFHLCNLFS